jgi:4-amino-4-deoxy-L-arabinose transferase-like glycosyltransferase
MQVVPFLSVGARQSQPAVWLARIDIFQEKNRGLGRLFLRLSAEAALAGAERLRASGIARALRGRRCNTHRKYGRNESGAKHHGQYTLGVRRVRWKHLLAFLAVAAIYISGLSRVGLLGPDEPRYASIGRDMAATGDWVTPRLWGDPWFEKPALLYWLIGLTYKAGFNDDLAPRLPVAIVSLGFLAFYFYRMRREFGDNAAAYATVLLATSAGWLVYTHIAVTDLILSAMFGSAVLLSLPWVRSGGRRGLALAGIFLGLAVLSKGLVPLVLLAPLLWVGRKRWTDLLVLAASCTAVAFPWYALCWLRNGNAFIDEFIWRQHFGRFVSVELQHPQPFWFFIPVILGFLFPWSPMIFTAWSSQWLKDSRKLLLLLITVFGFLFFSASANKLPGYVLPLLPCLLALIGIRLAEVGDARISLTVAALLLVLLPVVAVSLPDAMLFGTTASAVSTPPLWTIAAVVALVVAVVWLEQRRARQWAIAGIAGGVVCAVVAFKLHVFPQLDEQTSARPVWRKIAPRAEEVCLGQIHRRWLYGLQFYAHRKLPRCAERQTPVQILPGERERPTISTNNETRPWK